MTMPDATPSALVAITTATTTEVVPARPGSHIRVWQFDLENKHASTDTDVTFKSASTPLSGAILIKASGGSWGRGASGMAHFSTCSGEALNITTSAAGNIVGQIQYSYE